ncbi:MAG: carbohydrate kinase [Chitinophagaceae bacterium]|nr:MAG: carbohydrate kinase [Chitinophagaceae bacterium]
MKTGEVSQMFSTFRQMRIGVIGDLMLDTYWWGDVDRISPEAPVPIVAISGKEKRIAARPTSNKIRIISRNQHMMRLDSETTSFIKASEEKILIEAFGRYVKEEKPHMVIFEDYNKGVLSEKVIAECISICKKNKVLTAVDPKRKNFFSYKGVNIFKPNLNEAREGLNILREEISREALENMHIELHRKLDNEISLITLSERGIFVQRENDSVLIPTHVRNISDVSGAGDTVIAVAALVYAATENVRLMAEVANIAGGLVCEEVGTVAIDANKLMVECELLLS